MRNRILGAILIGVGLGLLINVWFPWLKWAWPLGLIAGGVLLWREIAPMAARVALIVASLTVGLFGANWGWGFNLDFGEGREIALLESNDELENSWQGLERVEILNTVGDIAVESNDTVQLDVTYRSNRPRTKAPEALQIAFNEGTHTLRIIGVDPKLSENERRGMSADIKLSLPEHVVVQVVNDVGDIRVEDMNSVSLETKKGDIKASRIAGKAYVRNDMGDISLEDIEREIEAQTRLGDINIKLDQPLNARLSAKDDVGDIKLSLPDDSNVTVTATSSTRGLGGDLERVTANEGRLRLGSGEFSVELSTNVGDISVEQR
jgi:Putative adhesin